MENLKAKKNSEKSKNLISLPELRELREANSLLRACYRCTIMQKRLIEYSIQKMQMKETQTLFGVEKKRVASFKISDFIEQYDIDNGGDSYESIKRAVKKFAGQGFHAETKGEYHYFAWFEQIHFSKANNKIDFVFTEAVGDRILELTKNFGVIKLNVSRQFQSFYASKFYDYAVSVRGMKGRGENEPNEWYFDLNEQQLRDFMSIGNEKYKNALNNFRRKVIYEPLREINEIEECDFTIKPYEKDEKTDWRFVCTEKSKNANQFKIKKSDSKAEQYEKRNINREDDLIQAHRQEYDELVAKYRDGYKGKHKKLGEFSADADARNDLKAKYTGLWDE